MVITHRKRLVTLTLMLLATAIVGCASEGKADPQGDTADAYAVVVSWFVDNSAASGEDSDLKQVVLIEALGEGVGIGLETQVALVAAADSFADVRFIDDRSEAMDGDTVRADVILLAIGPALTDGTTATVECDQILGEEVLLSWTFDLRYRADGWTLTLEPTPRE